MRRLDATPQKFPSEVEKQLQPLLEDVDDERFEMKAGELPDADYPQSHSSYYVATRCSATDPEAVQTAGAFIQKITNGCREMQLPVMEITSQHAEYQNLVSELGW